MSNIHQEAPMFYSGIDLHKDNCFITTVDDRGEIVKQERVRNVPEIILAYFASLDGSHKTVVECTAGWYWLNDLLEAHGIELVLPTQSTSKPSRMPKSKPTRSIHKPLPNCADSTLFRRLTKSDGAPGSRGCHASSLAPGPETNLVPHQRPQPGAQTQL